EPAAASAEFSAAPDASFPANHSSPLPRTGFSPCPLVLPGAVPLASGAHMSHRGVRMRKALRWLLALTVLIGTMSSAGAATAAEPEATGTTDSSTTDIKERLLAIPGMSLIEEKPYTGYRFFVLNYTQPVDHRRPSPGTFQQRITLLHKDVSRPTVFYTSGYSVSTTPRRSEPAQIVDGNQVSMEYRFFTPSRPEPADWSKLDIWQAASDQHRIFKALKKVYSKKWIATGGSK